MFAEIHTQARAAACGMQGGFSPQTCIQKHLVCSCSLACHGMMIKAAGTTALVAWMWKWDVLDNIVARFCFLLLFFWNVVTTLLSIADGSTTWLLLTGHANAMDDTSAIGDESNCCLLLLVITMWVFQHVRDKQRLHVQQTD